MNFHKVEIEITTRCNVLCADCDRRITQAPLQYDMPLSVIDDFISESFELSHHWNQIHILGGEPTLHPDIIEIAKRLSIFTSKYGTTVILISNDYSARTKQILQEVSRYCLVRKSTKPAAALAFDKMDVSVEDAKPCCIPNVCGLGYTFNGYFACGAGAAIARVLGYDFGVKKLKDISKEVMQAQLSVLCSDCGHALGIVKQNTSLWESIYKQYNTLSIF